MPPSGPRGPTARPGNHSSSATLPTAVIAGKWRVTRFLGAGSFGHVFAGQDIHDTLAPPVALKRAVFQTDKPTNQPSVGIDYLAAELAGLRQVLAAGEAPESLPKLFSDELIETPRGLIMVMSCHGPALATVKKALMVARMGGNEWGVSEMTASDKVVPRMGLDPEVVVDIGRQLGDTLDWIHRQGLVYCDMKLANIVLRHPNPPFTSPSFPADIVLIDHGLIRPIRPHQPASATSSGGQQNEPARNDRIGTPRYASISMHRGHPPTPSSDAESLAYTLFDLTLSHLPWTKVDAKPGPATWQAISRAKSHMTEHEWSVMLGEPDAGAPSAHWANTLIHLWDLAHLARPRFTGRFAWDQVFPRAAARGRPALWQGISASVLAIVETELAHAQAAAEREAGFRSPSATQLDSWGMPVFVKEAKVLVVNDPWGAAAGAGDVPPPNSAAAVMAPHASSGSRGPAWDDNAWAATESQGSTGWDVPPPPAPVRQAGEDAGEDDGWGAAADVWGSSSARGTGRSASGGGRPRGSDRGQTRGGSGGGRPHALQQEMSTQDNAARSADVWGQSASSTWNAPPQGRPTGGGRDGDAWGRSGRGDQPRSSPRRTDARGDDTWDARQGGRGSGRGASRWDAGGQSQDVRRAVAGGSGQRGAAPEWRASGGGGGWSGNTSRSQASPGRSGGGGGGWGGDDQVDQDDGWGPSSLQQGSRRGGGGRGPPRNTGSASNRGWR